MSLSESADRPEAKAARFRAKFGATTKSMAAEAARHRGATVKDGYNRAANHLYRPPKLDEASDRNRRASQTTKRFAGSIIGIRRPRRQLTM